MTIKLFMPLTKVDEAQRLVSGILSAEVPDKSGEIMDYDTGKQEFEKWSGEAQKRSNGKSLGNVRAMHSNIAAGKMTQIFCDDATKTIHGTAKIVDETEWNKVIEGVYTGFSIGGSYKKRWPDKENPELMRFTPDLSEVSIVDNPCVGIATFELIRANGAVEMVKFKKEEEAVKPLSLNKQFEGVEEPVQLQKWQAKDGSMHETKKEAFVRNQEIEKSGVHPALEAVKKLETALDKLETDENGNKIVKEAPKGKLKKGLFEVARVASLIEELNWVREAIEFEAIREDDGSEKPNELKDIMEQLCEFLVGLVEEECGEMTDENDTMAMAAGLPEEYAGALKKYVKMDSIIAELTKAGARHNKTDAATLGKLQEVHKNMGDHLKKMRKAHEGMADAHEGIEDSHKAMGKCFGKADGTNDTMKEHHAEMAGHIKKAVSSHSKAESAHESMGDSHQEMAECMKCLMPGEKAATVADGQEEMQKNLQEKTSELEKAKEQNQLLEKTVTTLTGDLENLTKRVEAIAALPLPAKGKIFALEKCHEVTASGQSPIGAINNNDGHEPEYRAALQRL